MDALWDRKIAYDAIASKHVNINMTTITGIRTAHTLIKEKVGRRNATYVLVTVLIVLPLLARSSRVLQLWSTRARGGWRHQTATFFYHSSLAFSLLLSQHLLPALHPAPSQFFPILRPPIFPIPRLQPHARSSHFPEIPPLQVKVRLTGNPLNSDPTVVLCQTLTRSALDHLAASSRRWKQWLGELERDMRPHSYGSAALSRKQLARNQKNLHMETASGPFKTETGLMGAFEFLPMRSKPLLSCVSRAFRVVAMKTEFADWFDTWDRPIKDGENNGGTTRGGSLEIDPVARGSDHASGSAGSAGSGSGSAEPEDQPPGTGPGLAYVILRFTITDLPPCRNEVYRFQFIRGMITVDLTDADAAPDNGAPPRPSRRATVPNLPSWRQLPGVTVGGTGSSTNPFSSRPVNREPWPPKKKPHRIRRFWNTLMHVVFRRKQRVVPAGSPPKLFPDKKS